MLPEVLSHSQDRVAGRTEPGVPVDSALLPLYREPWVQGDAPVLDSAVSFHESKHPRPYTRSLPGAHFSSLLVERTRTQL